MTTPRRDKSGRSDQVGTLLGLVEVCARTGLTRRQVRYYEKLGHLGGVGRTAGNRRRFTPAQVELLQAIATLRASGIALDDAVAVAREGNGELDCVPADRLRRLLSRAVADVHVATETMRLLSDIVAARLTAASASSNDR